MTEVESTLGPAPDVYKEYLNQNTILDLSSRELETLPEIKNTYLSVLYLQNNKLTSLPDDIFLTLSNLMYLDLRDNRLTDLPKTIKDHKCLTHLLLQNNELTHLPNELGYVPNLKVLQLNGNPLEHPPKNIIKLGLSEIVKCLKNSYVVEILKAKDGTENSSPSSYTPTESISSYEHKSVTSLEHTENSGLSIKLNERDSDEESSYKKSKGKCCRYNKTLHRKVIPSHFQSAKYVKPLYLSDPNDIYEKAKANFYRNAVLKKQKELIAKREKILQDRKSLDALKNWRQTYRFKRWYSDASYRLKPETFPYDTNPEYLTLLSRADIEKDLPDKYRKSITRRSRPSVPRKASDTNLALKIKQLFQNLQDMDVTRQQMTPRSEKRALLDEINKITEIKQKLSQLSIANQLSI